jgi:hypothetical protein
MTLGHGLTQPSTTTHTRSLIARPWPLLTLAICNPGLVRQSMDDVDADNDNNEGDDSKDGVATIFIVVVAFAISQVGDPRSSPWLTQACLERILGVPSTLKYLASVALHTQGKEEVQ